MNRRSFLMTALAAVAAPLLPRRKVELIELLSVPRDSVEVSTHFYSFSAKDALKVWTEDTKRQASEAYSAYVASGIGALQMKVPQLSMPLNEEDE